MNRSTAATRQRRLAVATPAELPPRSVLLRALATRDASFEGLFVIAVRTTGIFCRPGCPARTPKPQNVEFFATTKEALFAGFRACLRCRPLASRDAPPAWLAPLLAAIEADAALARCRPARAPARSSARASLVRRTARHDLPGLLARSAARHRAPCAAPRTQARRGRARPRLRIAQRLPRRVLALVRRAPRPREPRPPRRLHHLRRNREPARPARPAHRRFRRRRRLPARVQRPPHARSAARAPAPPVRLPRAARRPPAPDAIASRAL
ncbi:MAG: hypothetical protein EXS13_07930 [Planctomycetes bacterium]|nr:hypothetical protein [Planctomycetota bacterium]